MCILHELKYNAFGARQGANTPLHASVRELKVQDGASVTPSDCCECAFKSEDTCAKYVVLIISFIVGKIPQDFESIYTVDNESPYNKQYLE